MTARNVRLGTALLLSVSALLTSGAAHKFTDRAAGGACKHAQGRLFNASELGGAGRMTGTITGTYWYDIGTYREWDPDGEATDIIFNSGASRVEGKKGTITFQEYAALDFAENEGTNGAVLLVVTGGTGRWEGASGHLALAGFFHPEAFEGEWDYQGEICIP